jgi:hypothetical protein
MDCPEASGHLMQIRMFGARSKADWVVKHLAVDHGLVSELRFSGLDPR